MNNSKRIDSLDSIRGLAAISVVIFHCLVSFPIFYAAQEHKDYDNLFVKIMANTPLHTIWAGPEGVLLFFILSGFVLSLPFLNGKKIVYKDYLIKRFCRIYIPYLVIISISTIAVITLADFRNFDGLSEQFNNRWDHPVTFGAILTYIFMLESDYANVNGVAWSLVHEMRISIFFPLLILFIMKNKWLKSLIYSLVVCGVMAVGCKVLSMMIPNELGSFVATSIGNTFYYCIFFIFGALLAKHRHEIMTVIQPISFRRKLSLLAIAVLLYNFKWLVYDLFLVKFSKNALVSFGFDTINDIVASIGIVILLSVVLSSSKLDAFLNRKILVWFGKISYSLYLIHVIVIMLSAYYISAIVPMPVAIALVPFIALPVAHLSYKYIELPAISLGRKLTAKRNVTTKESAERVG